MAGKDAYNIHANHRSRMRSRIIKNGAASLEPHETLETMLYVPVTRRNTNDTAHLLIHRFGGVAEALAAPREELVKVAGVGPASADFLRELGRVVELCAASRRRERRAVTMPAEAEALAREHLAAHPDARCLIFALDSLCRLLGVQELPARPDSHDLIAVALRLRSSRAIVAFRDSSDAPETPYHLEHDSYNTLAAVLALANVELLDCLVCDDSGEVSSYLERLRPGSGYLRPEEREEPRALRHRESGTAGRKFSKRSLALPLPEAVERRIEQEPSRLLEIIRSEMDRLRMW